MNIAELTGQQETHLTSLDERTMVHKDVLKHFNGLQLAAQKAGFNLQVASGFRSFQRQLQIWNNKFSGKTNILDKNEQPISSSLSEIQKLNAILHWSALPGASRHHWGTDVDIYDPNLLPAGKKLQLIKSEYQTSGYFFELTQWLTENMHQFGFYRPYSQDLGGVAIEPWHISYEPIATHCLELLTLSDLHDLIIKNNVLGKSLICQQLSMIYKQYICNINLKED